MFWLSSLLVLLMLLFFLKGVLPAETEAPVLTVSCMLEAGGVFTVVFSSTPEEVICIGSRSKVFPEAEGPTAVVVVVVVVAVGVEGETLRDRDTTVVLIAVAVLTQAVLADLIKPFIAAVVLLLFKSVWVGWVLKLVWKWSTRADLEGTGFSTTGVDFFFGINIEQGFLYRGGARCDLVGDRTCGGVTEGDPVAGQRSVLCDEAGGSGCLFFASSSFFLLSSSDCLFNSSTIR
ncbi:hypothetical protein BD560DRAFT_418830 [Blakeslea trispora]|nr:hypothetical protein BD560DRAFT_418830 [Blakeslea trispora]